MVNNLVESTVKPSVCRVSPETLCVKIMNDQLSKSKPISTILDNGKTVTGTLWIPASRMGRFEVEYNGIRKTDGRTDYVCEAHMVAIARIILKELAES